jgi:hypothetical protein
MEQLTAAVGCEFFSLIQNFTGGPGYSGSPAFLSYPSILNL